MAEGRTFYTTGLCSAVAHAREKYYASIDDYAEERQCPADQVDKSTWTHARTKQRIVIAIPGYQLFVRIPLTKLVDQENFEVFMLLASDEPKVQHVFKCYEKQGKKRGITFNIKGHGQYIVCAGEAKDSVDFANVISRDLWDI